jgi:hypothetical protein
LRPEPSRQPTRIRSSGPSTIAAEGMNRPAPASLAGALTAAARCALCLARVFHLPIAGAIEDKTESRR